MHIRYIHRKILHYTHKLQMGAIIPPSHLCGTPTNIPSIKSISRQRMLPNFKLLQVNISVYCRSMWRRSPKALRTSNSLDVTHHMCYMSRTDVAFSSIHGHTVPAKSTIWYDTRATVPRCCMFHCIQYIVGLTRTTTH